MKRTPSFFITFLTSLSIFLVTDGNANANPGLSDNQWQVTIAPYVWALNMDGRVGVGPDTGHVSQSFSDILDDLSWGGMLWVDFKKQDFGIFINSLYAELSQQDSDGPVTVKVQNDFGIFSAGISYDAYRRAFTSTTSDLRAITLTPYLGARYTINDTTLKIPYFGVTAKENQNWVDPIIGLRMRYDMSSHWQFLLAGDIGGTNTSNDKSYDAQAYLGYSPSTVLTSSTWYLGYRLLYQDYTTGSGANRFVWDMKLHGPVLGVAFTF